MPIQLHEFPPTNVLEVDATGKLTDEDYKQFVPAVDRFIQEHHSKVRMLFDMHDFHGWDARAMWDDFRFGIHHARAFERIACVGEKRWQALSTKLGGLFLNAEVRYFPREELDEARRWLTGSGTAAA